MAQDLDTQLFLLVHQGLGRPWLDPVVQAVTWLGESWVALVAILATVAYLRRGQWRPLVEDVLIAGLTVALGGALVMVLKRVFDRPRPLVSLEHLGVLRDCLPMERVQSFPSGHAFNAFIAVTLLGFLDHRFWWFGYPVAALVALSRVYLGEHYPADVGAGAALGLAVGLSGAYFAQRLRPERWKSRSFA